MLRASDCTAGQQVVWYVGRRGAAHYGTVDSINFAADTVTVRCVDKEGRPTETLEVFEVRPRSVSGDQLVRAVGQRHGAVQPEYLYAFERIAQGMAATKLRRCLAPYVLDKLDYSTLMAMYQLLPGEHRRHVEIERFPGTTDPG